VHVEMRIVWTLTSGEWMNVMQMRCASSNNTSTVKPMHCKRHRVIATSDESANPAASRDSVEASVVKRVVTKISVMMD